MDRSLIDQFEDGIALLNNALEGLSPEAIAWVPPAEANIGLWSIHQIVIHLADAEASFADRIKRIIAEDDPVLLEWSEEKFLQRLFYNEQSVEDAVGLIKLTRKQLTRVLRKVPKSAFERSGNHSRRGKQTLADVIGFDNWHLAHHVEFIDKKKAAFSGSKN